MKIRSRFVHRHTHISQSGLKFNVKKVFNSWNLYIAFHKIAKQYHNIYQK